MYSCYLLRKQCCFPYNRVNWKLNRWKFKTKRLIKPDESSKEKLAAGPSWKKKNEECRVNAIQCFERELHCCFTCYKNYSKRTARRNQTTGIQWSSRWFFLLGPHCNNLLLMPMKQAFSNCVFPVMEILPCLRFRWYNGRVVLRCLKQNRMKRLIRIPICCKVPSCLKFHFQAKKDIIKFHLLSFHFWSRSQSV